MIVDAVAEINHLATQPFRETLPMTPIVLTLILLLALATQWRLILDEVGKVSP